MTDTSGCTKEIDPAALAEAYRLWPDPHDQMQGMARYGFFTGHRFASEPAPATKESARADLRRLANLWRTAERFQNGSGMDRVAVGDKAHAEALALENDLVARLALEPVAEPACKACGKPWLDYMTAKGPHACEPEEFDALENFAQWCLGASPEAEGMVEHIIENARAALAHDAEIKQRLGLTKAGCDCGAVNGQAHLHSCPENGESGSY